MKYLPYLYLTLPMISVYIVSLFYPVTKSAGSNVSFRPPPYVFAIVWPILLLLVGYSWMLRPYISKYYFMLIFLMSTWSILFKYSKLWAFYNIILTIILAIFIYFYKFNKLSSYLLIPLILWLSFASVISYYSLK